ncbi:pentatricopeptide repeat-containing protein At4g33170-like [Aristolochia californica]|uniref:pentatricopeptide repeat-containing protein At4g33170-like n=1 Tax=Aristolochia californica TaxID=171875 RepID=UPI0035D6C7E1
MRDGILRWIRIRGLHSTSTLQKDHMHTSSINGSIIGNMELVEEKFALLLQRCGKSSRLDLGQAIHAKFIKESLISTLFLCNHLLNMYCKCGELGAGLQFLDEMPERNVVSWSAMVAGFVQTGYPSEAISLFQQMQRDGIRPNEFSLVSALNACSLFDNVSIAYQIYAQLIQFGFESNVFLINAFLTALIRHQRLAEAEELFRKCERKDVVSWNAMVAGYLQFSYSKVWSFWCRMNRQGVRPDKFTFSSVLTGMAALTDLKCGWQVHAQLVKSGHGEDICVGNSLADMYLKNQNLIEGSKAFQEMPSKDVVSWTQMASGCLQCGQPAKALQVIAEMRSVGIRPNKFTLATAINACANLVSLEEGRKNHGLRIKLGDSMDACVDNATIDMYAKCGSIDSALRVFRVMNKQSVVSWTTMIMGYAQNGLAREALEIFEEMRLKNIKPNDITFICVLYACSQGGFVDEGWEYFSSMTRDYGIAPGEDHYACMVNLLGKTGHTKEAETLINNMPSKPGVLVWQTLLGACNSHGDIETGKRAAEQALALDKDDPSTYVLLSNMFAESSHWDGVGTLRQLMKNREVKKMPGCSWI